PPYPPHSPQCVQGCAADIRRFQIGRIRIVRETTKEHGMSFPGTGKIWMNGSMVEWGDAKIHVASHVIHYGSAVFEGARCYDTPRGTACFRIDAHIRRLLDSARIYRMESPYSQQAIIDAVNE